MDKPGEIALFPLNTVLFPGGVLPLRISRRAIWI
jgi:Lon protease-like protein